MRLRLGPPCCRHTTPRLFANAANAFFTKRRLLCKSKGTPDEEAFKLTVIIYESSSTTAYGDHCAEVSLRLTLLINFDFAYYSKYFENMNKSNIMWFITFFR
jgi:hypothetical protein